MIKRITTHTVTGNIRTKIYKVNCFKKTLLHDYGFEFKLCRTIGYRESHLGLPSVDKEYGDIWYDYIYKNYLILKKL